MEKESAKRDFISEAEEILEELTGDIQSLETSIRRNNVRPDLINKIFRQFHSLKGISGMLGFEKISGFTHELENMLDNLRLGKIAVSQKVVDVLFQSMDLMHGMIAELIDEQTDGIDPGPVLRKVNELIQEEESSAQRNTFPELDLDQQTLQSLTEYEEHRLHENVIQGAQLYNVRLVLDNATFDLELREISDLLNQHGEVISTLPSFEISAGPGKMVFRLLYGTGLTAEAILRKLGRTEITASSIRKEINQTGRVETLEEEQEPEKALETSLKSLSRTVRVDIQKLDEVINVIGELVITRAMVANVSRELIAAEGHSRLGITLSRVAVDLEKKLNELQRNVIETRLVPVGQIYHKLGRMVRKLSRETNKQVDLRFSGEDTELDKIMIEELSDPLMHIIRNAIDHGIESGDERKKAGKPDRGTIRLSAFQRGNNVVIQVQDDGRGIQIKKVQEQARKRGLLPADRVPDIKECIDILFSPGFSSSDEVTELSGRGVGLDVVKKNISGLKGFISVSTEEGRGTMFEITLPITLAIIQALIVKTGETKYAVPMSSVSETVQIENSNIHTVDRKEVYCLRDRTIPLIRISEVFQLPQNVRGERQYLVIVNVGEHSAGLVVDELAGQQEIVIKSMGEKLKNIPGIAGATEIGESKPVLVIDAESMVEEATHGRIRAG